MIAAWIPGTRAWRRRRDMQMCHLTGARIQEIVDGELPRAVANQRLLVHLEACRRCQAEAEAIRQLKEAIARVASDVDPGLVANLEDLCHRLADEQDDG